MKKIVLSACLAALVLGACETPAGEEAVYIPGTYTASAQGFNREKDLTVRVEFSADKILTVTIVDHGESIDRTEPARALSRIPRRIEEAQSAEVDVVTNATKTSNAIKAAVRDCIAQAKIARED